MHIDKAIVQKIESSLKFSTAEGMAYGAVMGFGDNYIVAFAVALQTSSLQIGILCSVPGFLASIAQLWDTALVRRLKSRKKLVMLFALMQGLMFLPMLGLAFFPGKSDGWWMILFTAIYSISAALTSPAWGSIMAEVVPNHLRGKYFSLRGSLATLANTVTFLTAGIFLTFLVHKELWGFAVLFGAACIFRLISVGLLTKLYEMPLMNDVPKPSKSGNFVRELTTTNLGRYMLFLFCMSFAVNIGSPYFAVYQLHDLKQSYFTFAALGTISSVATLLTITRWGKVADRVGNLKVLLVAGALIPFIPLLWLISTNLVVLGFVQAFSGLAWAGFNLCSVNYLYDATSGDDRTKYLAYFNCGNGLAAGVGALLGGFLVTHMPVLRGSQVLSIFLISGILRGAASLIFLPRLKEVRRVSTVPASELFHILTGGRPVDRRLSHRRFSLIHHHEPVDRVNKAGSEDDEE
jgi:MFS family permease